MWCSSVKHTVPLTERLWRWCEWACSEWLFVMNHQAAHTQKNPPPPIHLHLHLIPLFWICVGLSHSGLMYLVITGHYHCGRACHGALCSVDPLTQQMCLKAVKWTGGRGAVIKTTTAKKQNKQKKRHAVLLSYYLSAPNHIRCCSSYNYCYDSDTERRTRNPMFSGADNCTICFTACFTHISSSV